MKTLELRLDDALMAELEAASARRQRDAASLTGEIVRRYLEAERARLSVQAPDLVSLYRELSDEDVALAETGMADYARLLEESDREGRS